MPRSVFSRDFLHQLIEHLPFEVLVFDKSGMVLFQNARSKLSGRAPSFEAFLAMIHPDDRAKSYEDWTDIFTGKTSGEDSFLRKLGKDKTYIWVQQKVIALDAFFVGVFYDVHHLRMNEEKRAKMMSGLSHDLRNPLTSARLKAQVAARVSSDQRFIDVYLQIVKDMDRADKMICDLLDAGKFEAGISPLLHAEVFDLGAKIEEVVSELRLIYGNRYVVSNLKGISGYWDKDFIRRILENLLANALKYGEPDRPIEIRFEEKGEWVSISIINRGIPIPPEVQATLFQRYERAGQYQSVGWGLGLSVAKELCEAHGGNISVRSTEEEGTVFTVALPRDARSLRVEKT